MCSSLASGGRQVRTARAVSGFLSPAGLAAPSAAGTHRQGWATYVALVLCPVSSLRVSCWQQYEVIVDVYHGHVEGRHLIYTQGLVPSRVQLLGLQLPLHPLHGIEGRSLMLLPHQQARLWNTQVRGSAMPWLSSQPSGFTIGVQTHPDEAQVLPESAV